MPAVLAPAAKTNLTSLPHAGPALQAAHGDQQHNLWELPAALLPRTNWTVVEVTVSKGAGAQRRSGTARTLLKLTPTSSASADATPRGFITRAGSPGGLHAGGEPLGLTTVLAPGSEAADVSWSSPDVDLLGPAGGLVSDQLKELDLTLPAALLQQVARPWVTLYADLNQGKQTTRLATTVKLDQPPRCTEPSCLTVRISSSSFPTSTAVALARGFTHDDSQGAMTYEFGVQHKHQLVPEAAGLIVPHYTFRSLPPGDTTVYVCAVDSAGGAACSTQLVRIDAPSASETEAAAGLVSGPVGSSKNEPAAAVCRARQLAAAASALTSDVLRAALESSTAELSAAAAAAGSPMVTLQVR